MTSAISKTKNNLIDVARQLFAKKGVENTTMNDIAEASQRGRRTLYTYFSSKNEIYKAVIESELNVLYGRLEEVTHRDIPADEKLILLAFTRLNAIKEVVTRNGTLRADFFRDIWKVENVRKEFDKKEIHYLETIIRDGCDKGIFRLKDIRQTAEILHYAFKGLEVPTIRGAMKLDYNKKEDREIISGILFKGLYAK
ncbi:MAG: TetR family transcriptional regulator [Bacteroidetes bacterium GWD2_45_23]|nr:MAG: TetR family transcriptional regulator [Bacteroidetes bacterium GWC2_46_850]OFX80194.1 MAG: TetR family transcriptional regulator [Bacteroidetes bacterium GWC1_47_7]OFX82680.1 MAG: TetR family transcriptional regulator [Bacteroidetes bacterium GWD2_45_23]HAR37178.1 TetR family transcriptional regulator [Porphyromonadaceae bacterium]HBB02039.1 TetR family transcriptional regulator [Porphyromonadaceae bacterium]